MHAKNKKISLMLDQLKSYVNSFEFGSDVKPLANLNWEDLVGLDGGEDAFKTLSELDLD